MAVFVATICLAANSAFAADNYTEHPGTAGNGTHTIGPDYEMDPDHMDQGDPKGMNFEFSMRLTDSRIFRGDDFTQDPKKMCAWSERFLCMSTPPTKTERRRPSSFCMLGRVV